jgi:6-phosphogluconate dehydrogenase
MARSSATADVGLIGLAVMGQNLVLNMADHGFAVAVHNRTKSVMDAFVARNPGTPGPLIGCSSPAAFVKALKRPRRIIILVKAGDAVDAVIKQVVPLLSRGDVIVDGGNSLWTDTIRRERQLVDKGIHFVGSGVSGGEEGARFGPSLMPGGSREAWKHLRPVWTAIAAKVDKRTGKPLEGAAPGKPVRGGEPCTAYVGTDGSGHYVKMVHNGIEYADMQLICESYQIMKDLLGMKGDEMSQVFGRWNRGDLNSFLIEITADILQQRDPANPKRFLVDMILDAAGQKGTGKWTAINALDMGICAPSIAEAVFARCISADKNGRVEASRVLRGPRRGRPGAKQKLVAAIRDALYCSKLCSYAQGFALMTEAQSVYNWKLNFGRLAMMWRGGCIIRAGFLQKIKEAYDRNPKLANLLLDAHFKRKIHSGQANWRHVVGIAAQNGIPAPQMMSCLAYYDSFRCAVLPANLLQGQRDYFGAHTYERVDAPRGRLFHVDWPKAARPQARVK